MKAANRIILIAFIVSALGYLAYHFLGGEEKGEHFLGELPLCSSGMYVKLYKTITDEDTPIHYEIWDNEGEVLSKTYLWEVADPSVRMSAFTIDCEEENVAKILLYGTEVLTREY